MIFLYAAIFFSVAAVAVAGVELVSSLRKLHSSPEYIAARMMRLAARYGMPYGALRTAPDGLTMVLSHDLKIVENFVRDVATTPPQEVPHE